MRGARLVLGLMALPVLASLAYTVEKVYAGAAQMTASHGYAFAVSLEWGLALPVVAAVLLAIGAVRFGVIPVVEAQAPASADAASPRPPRKPKRKKR
jgi:hypothetical protein